MATQLPPAPAPPVAARPVGASAWSGQPAYPPPPPQPPVHDAPGRRGSRGPWILASIAALASAGALALGVIAVSTQPSAPPAPEPASATASPILFDETADRALCEALPDLMREANTRSNAYINTPVDSAERRAAMPQFKAESEDWAARMQQVIADHASPDRYLTRTLQRYVDDVLLYSQNIYPERSFDKFDDTTWNLAIVDYGGALGRCQQLGISWK